MDDIHFYLYTGSGSFYPNREDIDLSILSGDITSNKVKEVFNSIHSVVQDKFILIDVNDKISLEALDKLCSSYILKFKMSERDLKLLLNKAKELNLENLQTFTKTILFTNTNRNTRYMYPKNNTTNKTIKHHNTHRKQHLSTTVNK
jgi:hypothetical protein